MQRLRVLRLIARTNVGGPALQVAALTTGLDPERFESRLLVGRVEPDEADYLELRAPDVEYTSVPGLGRTIHPTDDLLALRHIIREIRAFRPHIVHTHTAKAGVLGRVAAELSRTSARVHTFHGHLLHGYFSPGKTRAVITAERVLARRTTKLAVVGRRVRDDLLAAGIGQPAQYVVMPPGVPQPQTVDRREARDRLQIPRGVPVVAFVARLTAVKRPDRFADVARRVSEARPEVHFVVAGGGELFEELRANTASLGERMHLLEWSSEVGLVYSAANVVLLTSDNEGMPVSLIEAAMCGRSAVTTDVGSASEVVENEKTGIVTSTNTDEIAAATLRLVDDSELASRFGAEAARRARDRFSTARLVADTAALYEDVAQTLGFDR